MIDLYVYSIFNSISGEVGIIPQGSLTTFIRLSGCNLRCSYCDTAKTWEKEAGTLMSVKQIVNKVEEIGCKNILITGGEPLMQMEGLKSLIMELNGRDAYNISVETNGAILLPLINGVNTTTDNCWFLVDGWIIDYKLGSSREKTKMVWSNFTEWLPPNSVIKFVCSNYEDFVEAKHIVQRLKEEDHHQGGGLSFAFSPIIGKLEPAQLVKWMQDEKLYDCIFSLQIHKFIWPEGEEGDV